MEINQLDRARFRDMRGYLSILENAGLLKRIKSEVDLEYELGAIASISVSSHGPALLFENIKGYNGQSLVVNIISTPKELALAFGSDESTIYDKIVEGIEHPVQPTVMDSGPCKEEKRFGEDVDLDEFPTPTWHELDGGRYLGTCAGCISRHPESGSLNMGTYRLMIKGKNLLSMSVSRYQDIIEHIRINEKLNRPTPMAVAMGMDPLLTLASGTKIRGATRDAEFAVAGSWRKEPVELVKCETNDLLVPANAEIILEGEVQCGERTHEGPHGEGHGFYGEEDDAFVFHVNCVTHRTNPVSYGLICNLIEDFPRQLMQSGAMQAKLNGMGFKNVRKVNRPDVTAYSCYIIAADVQSATEPRKIMDAVWSTSPFTRWVVVVDPDTDVHDWNDVMWRICTTVMPEKDIVMTSKQIPSGHDPLSAHYAEHGGIAHAIGLDATTKFKQVNFPPTNKVSVGLKDAVMRKWKDLGLDSLPMSEYS